MNEWIVPAACAVLALAALQDLAQLRISNWWSIALLLIFGVWASQNVGLDQRLWHNLGFAIAVFAFGAFLFWLRWFGGGDVKLMAAAAIWFDWQAGLWYMVSVMIGGGVLGLALIFGRRFAAAWLPGEPRWPGLKPRGPIPYGIAIAAGAIFSLWIGGARPVPVTLPGLELGLPVAPMR